MDRNQLLCKVTDDLRSLKHPSAGYLFAGGKNFRWLFGRDSLITSLMLLSSASNGPQIAKDTLEILSNLQGKSNNWKSEEQPGKILHEARDTELLKSQIPFWEFPYYGTVDATPLFIILARKYAESTNDWGFIKKLWKNLEAAAHWLKYYGDIDGDYFIECKRLNPRGIVNQCWKDHTPFSGVPEYPVCFVEVQGYAYLAYKCMAEMSAHFKRPEWREYYEDAEALKYNFNIRFWDNKNEVFALALDGKKNIINTATSNPGHLFFTGIIDTPEKMRKTADRLCQPDLWTPFGIRTLSSKEISFDPYRYHLGSIWLMDNWMIYYGWKNYIYTHPFEPVRIFDFRPKAQELKEIMIRTACLLEEAPELYACDNGELKTAYHVSGWGMGQANHVQAWSAAAIVNLLSEDLAPKERSKLII